MFGDDDGLHDNTSFLESGIIDSTGIMELVNFLEETFFVKILDRELVPENLDTLDNISAFLQLKIEVPHPLIAFGTRVVCA